MSTTTIAPVWDMTVIFPSLDSAEFHAAFESSKADLARLENSFDAWGVHGGQTAPDAASVLEKVVTSWDQFESAFTPVRSYIYSFVSTDTTNTLAQAKLSEMDPMASTMSKLYQRMTAWIGGQDLTAILAKSQIARDHEYFLSKCMVMAKHQMSPIEEDLAADLATTGSLAWGRLHGDATAQIQVRVALPTGEEHLPMSVTRALAYDPSREVRQAAYEAELATWKQNELPLATAMNCIKAEVGMLSKRRGWDSPLEAAAFGANIDLATLEAMMSAARDAFPMLRRYLKAKGKMLHGGGALDWHDLFAPVGESTKTWEYEEGAAFVAKQFHSYSTRMGEFAERNYRENWIDALPKAGKQDGAFCMGLRRDESRILMTWKPSFGSVSTLAHELGHGYHNLCLYGRTELQRETPMTLAETASIFCETIVSNAAMEQAEPNEKISILEQSLQRVTQTVVDITSRYLFEREVFEKRQDRALSADEFCDLMLWAQGQTYGDGLSEKRHPYMWAVKGHYYSNFSFYNFPYMFGHLFSLGLYSLYLQDPERFKGSYDELLSSTGLADAATLAQRFDIDITTSKFWEGSLSAVERDVERFEALA